MYIRTTTKDARAYKTQSTFSNICSLRKQKLILVLIPYGNSNFTIQMIFSFFETFSRKAMSVSCMPSNTAFSFRCVAQWLRRSAHDSISSILEDYHALRQDTSFHIVPVHSVGKNSKRDQPRHILCHADTL